MNQNFGDDNSFKQNWIPSIEDKMLTNYQATLLGCGIGDSLGMPVEGWSKEQIVKYVGKITDLIDPQVVLGKRKD